LAYASVSAPVFVLWTMATGRGERPRVPVCRMHHLNSVAEAPIPVSDAAVTCIRRVRLRNRRAEPATAHRGPPEIGSEREFLPDNTGRCVERASR
jgi:hypothetical protein